MPLPANADQMRMESYRFADHACCDACGEPVEWWISPQGRNILMNPMPTTETRDRLHAAVCGKRGSLRKKASER